MAPRKTTTTRRTAVVEPEETNGSTSFEEVDDESFPSVSRTSTKLSVYMDDAAALAAGKKGSYPVETKEESDKIAAQLRQVLRRFHNQSLTAVYMPNELRLYVKSGGEYKARGPRQPKETVTQSGTNAVSKARGGRR